MTDATIPLDVTEAPTAPARPRTRWAGIVWGLVFAGLAGAGIGLSATADRLDDLAVWLQGLEVGAAIGHGLLVAGALVLATGLVGLLRRAQRTLADRHPTTPVSEEIVLSEEPVDGFPPHDGGSPR